MGIIVRPLNSDDREEWQNLWRKYLEFYKTEIPDAVYDAAFERMLSSKPGEFHGLLAIKNDEPVGLAHYLFHRHGWKIEKVCYLQDLFVAEKTRGTGIGRALIEAVYARADAAGASSVYWLTQDFNAVARRLYDRVAAKTSFIKYSRHRG